MAIEINGIAELQLIGNDPGYPLNGSYELGQDIDASATVGWNAGAGFIPIGSAAAPFTGSFDGKWHTINGLNIHRALVVNVPDYIALFAVAHNATIRRVTLVGCDISCTALLSVAGNWTSRTGTIIGETTGSTRILNITSSGSVSSEYSSDGVGVHNIDMATGGLVGINGSTISGCSSACIINVDGHRGTGGLVGINTGIIRESYSTGSVTTIDSDPLSVSGDCGGFVYENSGTIEDCYCTGDVTGVDDTGGFVFENTATGIIRRCCATGDVVGTTPGESSCAGFCGWENYGLIERCYCTGDVTTPFDAAGFVIDNHGAITCCYCTGDVTSTGEDAGGFVEENNGGTIQRCACTGNVTADDDAGGFVRYNHGAGAVVQNCFCTGNVTSGDDAGGFVDSNTESIDNCYCVNELNSGSGDVGGFCQGNGGTITRCFWNTDTAGTAITDGGTGLTTEEMKMQSNYNGWSFPGVWQIIEDTTYPFVVCVAEAAANITAEPKKGAAPLRVQFGVSVGYEFITLFDI